MKRSKLISGFYSSEVSYYRYTVLKSIFTFFFFLIPIFLLVSLGKNLGSVVWHLKLQLELSAQILVILQLREF